MGGRKSGVGGDDRFVAFYRDEYLPATRLGYLLTGCRATAEDLVQDAFLRLQPRFDGIDHPRAYLRASLVNGARSQHRKRRRGETAIALLPRRAEGGLQADELLDAVARLPYRERAVLVLRYYADLPEAEIAGVLGCRPNTVRTTAARALQKLRKEIER